VRSNFRKKEKMEKMKKKKKSLGLGIVRSEP
jgi:hypothetical protein